MSHLNYTSSSKPSLIYIGIDSWFSIHQRPQHLARSLSQYFRVLYVDPACYTMLGYVRNHLRGDGSRVFRAKCQEVQPDLYLFRSAPVLPLPSSTQWANDYAIHSLSRVLTRVIRDLDFGKAVLVLSWPLDLPLVDTLGESLVCYDCMDNYAAFKVQDPKRAKLITAYESALIGRANLVFASSKPIHARISRDHPATHLVRNAVSQQFLKHKLEAVPPHDWPAGDGPVIGYVGMVAEWFDVDAVVQLATRNPTWRIVIIGPVARNMGDFGSLPNLHFLGVKRHEDLPSYVARFDIALIPFLLNELTLAVNPVKVYEYWALGKPVVAMRLPELLAFNDLLYLASSTSEFVELVEQVAEEATEARSRPGESAAVARREAAVQNTWELRARAVHELIQSAKENPVRVPRDTKR